MKKKLLTVAVVISLVFCMLPVGLVLSAEDVAGVNAAATGACGPAGPDNLPLSTVQWTYLDGKLTISGTGDMGDFTEETLPWADYTDEISSVEVGEGVTSVGTGAFRNFPATVFSVSLPSTVTAIGDDAFSGDAGLTSLTLPAALTSVGNSAFADTGLTVLALPDSVTFLGTGVFQNDTALAAISLPDQLSTLNDNTFYNCSGLSAVRLPDALTTIAPGAFYGSGLIVLALPDAVASVGDGAFAGCTFLTDIGSSSMNAIFSDDAFDGASPVTIHGPADSGLAAYAADRASLGLSYTADPLPEIIYPEIDETFVTAPAGDDAESSWTSGTDSEAGTAGENADASAAGTAAGSADTGTGTEVSATDEAIARALAAADAVGTDETANSVPAAEAETGGASAADSSIYAATGEEITDMTGGETADAVSLLAADAESETEDAALTGTIGASGNEANVAWAYDTDTGALTISGSGAMKDFSVTDMAPWTEQNSAITTITISSGVTNIGARAFANLTASTARPTVAVTLPATVTSIGTDAFANSTAVTTLDFSALTGLKSIGESAFYGSGLTAAALPSSVTSIGESAFQNCTALASVTLPAALTRIEASEFRNDTALTAMTIPETVTYIGYAAFQNTGLTAVTLPAAVATVESNAFSGCSSLTSATVTSKTTAFGTGVFPSTVTLTVESGSTAETYAKNNNIKYKYANLPMTGIAINLSAATLAPKATLTLAVSAVPEGATDYKETAWKSSNEKIATVSSTTDGTAIVTAVAAGTATITATASNTAGKTFTATSAITVSGGSVAELLKAATVTLGDQNAAVTGMTSTDTNVAAAAKAIDDKAKTGKLTIASGAGLTAAIATAQTNARALKEVSDYLTANPPASATDAVTLTVRPLFNITVTAATADSVTYDITPVYNVDVKVGATEKKDVAKDQALPVTGTVTMTIPLPSGLSSAKELYITHKLKNNSYKYYKGTVASSLLTFDNPDGFSEFAVTTAKPAGYQDSGNSSSAGSKVRNIIYRLFNKRNGDHLFTRDKVEYNFLKALGFWSEEEGALEGYNEADTNKPIYRLFNKNTGEHLMTNSAYEKDVLAKGNVWVYEGVAWYGASSGDSPIYRMYNPKGGLHLYTTNAFERGFLTALGWKNEGILCYQTN